MYKNVYRTGCVWKTNLVMHTNTHACTHREYAHTDNYNCIKNIYI